MPHMILWAKLSMTYVLWMRSSSDAKRRGESCNRYRGFVKLNTSATMRQWEHFFSWILQYDSARLKLGARILRSSASDDECRDASDDVRNSSFWLSDEMRIRKWFLGWPDKRASADSLVTLPYHQSSFCHFCNSLFQSSGSSSFGSRLPFSLNRDNLPMVSVPVRSCKVSRESKKIDGTLERDFGVSILFYPFMTVKSRPTRSWPFRRTTTSINDNEDDTSSFFVFITVFFSK